MSSEQKISKHDANLKTGWRSLVMIHDGRNGPPGSEKNYFSHWRNFVKTFLKHLTYRRTVYDVLCIEYVYAFNPSISCVYKVL